MRELFIEVRKPEKSVQNICISKSTMRCEECIKSDVCRLKESLEEISQRTAEMANEDFEVEIKCRHFA